LLGIHALGGGGLIFGRAYVAALVAAGMVKVACEPGAARC
jgi:hypothetical protein